MRALAALRWINGRNSALQGQGTHAGLAAHLQAVDNQLRTVSQPSFVTSRPSSVGFGAVSATKRQNLSNNLLARRALNAQMALWQLFMQKRLLNRR